MPRAFYTTSREHETYYQLSHCSLPQRNFWLIPSRVLMLAAQEERTRQQEMGKQIVSEIASAMLLQGEKSLDMLQSLCICNLWLVINLCPMLMTEGRKITDFEQGLLLHVHFALQSIDCDVSIGSCIAV
jgi:hypothetical protein